MRTYQKISELCRKLPLDQQKQVLEMVQTMIDGQDIQDETARTSRLKLPNPHCPYCGVGGHTRKMGTKAGKQRYQCTICHRTFTETTHTIMENSHATRSQWKQVIIDTLDGQSIDHTASCIGLHHETVFNMRHKILIGMTKYLEEDPVVLEEIAELDETYVLESLKGSKFPDNAPRPPRRHGERANKRGLSGEQVCICAGVQRNHGAAFASTVNRAQPNKEEIRSAFDGHIGTGTVVFTDGAKSYCVLEEILDCAVEKVSAEEQKRRKVANLNNVNSFHSFIKERYGKYRGVATKYLNRYNMLFSSAFRDRAKMIDRFCEALMTPGLIDYSVTNNDVEAHGLLDI